MDLSIQAFLSGFVDMIVIVTTACILAFAIFRGAAKFQHPIPFSGLIVIAGLTVMALGYLLQFGLQFLDSSVLTPSEPQIAAVTDWIGWGLTRLAFVMISVGFIVAILKRDEVQNDLKLQRAEVVSLQADESRSERRFNYLFDSTSNSMYCFECDPPIAVDLPIDEQIERSYDAILTQCNSVFAHELEVGQASEAIGLSFSALESSKDRAAHTAFFRCFVENNYRLSNYELAYTKPDGAIGAVNVNMIGIVHDGRLERFWAVESNVAEIKRAEAALQKRSSFQQVNANISTRLVKVADANAHALVEQALGEICAYFGADRSSVVWLGQSEKEPMTSLYWWSSGAGPWSPKVFDELFPNLWSRMRQFQTLRIDRVSELSEEYAADKQNLAERGVRSLIIVPLLFDDEALGGLTLARVRNDAPWEDQDIVDLTVLSELIANFVIRLRSRRQLANALADLKIATDRLEAENTYLREEVVLSHGFDEIVGESDAILHSLQQVKQVANTNTPVLILGETGTGKELIARALHDRSDRREHSLVKVNCAALPENLIESELFGHEKGAFTGADRSKRGRFDLADGSTLFLDEIGEMPIELQAKLLRVLQDGKFERLGGTKTVSVDVRIIAATNRDLNVEVQRGEFRSDLLYRINTFPIELPPLRDRDDDVSLLTRHFVELNGQRLGRDIREISAETMRQLRGYHWPGNIRELDGIIQRALIASSGPTLDLAEPLVTVAFDDGTPKIKSSSIAKLKLVEHDHILAVLEESDWKISGKTGAAAQLGMPPSTLRSKMKKLHISRPR